MADSKKKREAAKRRSVREPRPCERSVPLDARIVKPDVHREIRYITQLAHAED